MNSGLHCRMAGCYDSRLLLTVFGLGRTGEHTHADALRRIHAYTRTLTTSSSALPLHTHTHIYTHLHIWHQPHQMELIPCLPAAIFCLLRISLYLAIVKPAWLCEYIQKHVWSGCVVCVSCASGEALQYVCVCGWIGERSWMCKCSECKHICEATNLWTVWPAQVGVILRKRVLPPRDICLYTWWVSVSCSRMFGTWTCVRVHISVCVCGWVGGWVDGRCAFAPRRYHENALKSRVIPLN